MANLAFVNLDNNPSTSPEAGNAVFLWHKQFVCVCVHTCVCMYACVHMDVCVQGAFIKLYLVPSFSQHHRGN